MVFLQSGAEGQLNRLEICGASAPNLTLGRRQLIKFLSAKSWRQKLLSEFLYSPKSRKMTSDWLQCLLDSRLTSCIVRNRLKTV